MHISLKAKIWVFVNLSVLSITVFAYFYFPADQYRYLVNNQNKEVQYIANTIATGITIALSDGNFQGIKTSMEYAQADSRLRFVAMAQTDSSSESAITKKIFRIYPENAGIDVNISSTKELIVKRAPFTSDIMVGDIIIGFDTTEIISSVDNLQNRILITGGIVLIISSILSYFISKTITKPLQDLRHAALRISTGNLDLILNIKRNDELGDLSKAFNKMVISLLKNRRNIKRKHQQLEKVNLELVNLNNEKNNLMSIVSHDLKSPINQIKGLISLLKLDGSMSSGNFEILNQADLSLERWNEMITKILDVEAIESHSMNLKMERLDIGERLQHALMHFKLIAAGKQITFYADTQLNTHFVKADKSYVIQVFDNLISNAIKFSPSSSAIYIRIIPEPEFIKVEIQDEGPGISNEDQTMLFNKYQRLSARPTAGESSTGLGLSIVKKYVEMMEGKVYYEAPEKGGKFVVVLKRLPAPAF